MSSEHITSEQAAALCTEVDKYIGDTIEYTILVPRHGDLVQTRVLHMLNQQHKLIMYALARIAQLEAENEARKAGK